MTNEKVTLELNQSELAVLSNLLGEKLAPIQQLAQSLQAQINKQNVKIKPNLNRKEKRSGKRSGKKTAS